MLIVIIASVLCMQCNSSQRSVQPSFTFDQNEAHGERLIFDDATPISNNSYTEKFFENLEKHSQTRAQSVDSSLIHQIRDVLLAPILLLSIPLLFIALYQFPRLVVRLFATAHSYDNALPPVQNKK
ncbi:hypothetical protein ENBRE01_3302 [Enteropsectra breve]|nr:hypothetical protein ENBRE01_3077 [Enteropsectra breve]KAI5154120.1 hypothetical protein ENBRE01_3302 [Enteropsectra breve]